VNILKRTNGDEARRNYSRYERLKSASIFEQSVFLTFLFFEHLFNVSKMFLFYFFGKRAFGAFLNFRFESSETIK